ncbi:MAG TPA: hypothetical protein VH331_18720 [Allosphingosinicella sp.]|jgi:hypothetical protein|nr:hypothetical protein [Allosphingosinicella sp.]
MDVKCRAPAAERIISVPPVSPKADPNNPKAHKPPQVAAIAKSIRTFGFNVLVLVDQNDKLPMPPLLPPIDRRRTPIGAFGSADPPRA